MAFIELKFKVFWLRDERKLSSLYGLFNYLKKLRSDKSSEENAKCFLTSIRKTLEGLLLTFDGQLYLGELANDTEKSQREIVAKDIKRQLKQRDSVVDIYFAKSQYFKLLDLVNWNEKIANFIVLKLLFS